MRYQFWHFCQLESRISRKVAELDMNFMMEPHKVSCQSFTGYSIFACGDRAQEKVFDMLVVLRISTVFQHINDGFESGRTSLT